VCHHATYTQAVNYRRLVSSVMTQGKSASMGLLALTTLASGLGKHPLMFARLNRGPPNVKRD